MTAERCNIAFPYVNGASSAVSLTQRGSAWFFRAGPPTSTSPSRCPLFFKLDQDQILSTSRMRASGPIGWMSRSREWRLFSRLFDPARLDVVLPNRPDRSQLPPADIRFPRPRGCGRTSSQQDHEPSQRHPRGRCGASTKTLATQVGYKAMADVAYDAGKRHGSHLPGGDDPRRKPRHLLASSSTSDAILPMQAGPEPVRLPPPMILAHGASFSDPIFLPLVRRRQKEG